MRWAPHPVDWPSSTARAAGRGGALNHTSPTVRLSEASDSRRWTAPMWSWSMCVMTSRSRWRRPCRSTGSARRRACSKGQQASGPVSMSMRQVRLPTGQLSRRLSPCATGKASRVIAGVGTSKSCFVQIAVQRYFSRRAVLTVENCMNLAVWCAANPTRLMLQRMHSKPMQRDKFRKFQSPMYMRRSWRPCGMNRNFG